LQSVNEDMTYFCRHGRFSMNWSIEVATSGAANVSGGGGGGASYVFKVRGWCCSWRSFTEHSIRTTRQIILSLLALHHKLRRIASLYGCCTWVYELRVHRVCLFLLLHLFIQAISIAHLQVHYYSEALQKQHGYCFGVSRRSATGNCEWRTFPRSRRGGYRAEFEPATRRTKGAESTN